MMATRKARSLADRRFERLRRTAATATVAVLDDEAVVPCAWCGRLVVTVTVAIPHGTFTRYDNLDQSPHRCGPEAA